jgi:uridine kinase
MRVYVRTLSMVMSLAVKRLYPEAVLHIAHSISKGYFCKLSNPGRVPVENDILQIKNSMNLMSG